MKEEEMYKDERWLPIPDYEGWYDISDFGRVKRVMAACGAQVGRILKSPASGTGYYIANLYKHGDNQDRESVV